MHVRIAWVSIVLAGCFDSGRAPDEVPAPNPAPPKEAEAPLAIAAAEPDPAERLGKVVESLTSGGYTYALLENCGEQAWVAGPETPLEVGAIVTMPQGMGMENFRSPSLDRTFETILFVDHIKPSTEEIRCAEPLPAPKGADGIHGAADGEKPPPPKVFHGRVAETMESGGYTYARIQHCGQETWLAGKRIPVKIGQFIKAPQGDEMNGFSSKTLGRTFESIFFVPSIAIAPDAPACR